MNVLPHFNHKKQALNRSGPVICLIFSHLSPLAKMLVPCKAQLSFLCWVLRFIPVLNYFKGHMQKRRFFCFLFFSYIYFICFKTYKINVLTMGEKFSSTLFNKYGSGTLSQMLGKIRRNKQHGPCCLRLVHQVSHTSYRGHSFL